MPKRGENDILVITDMEIISTRLLTRFVPLLFISAVTTASAADLILQKVAPLTLEQAPRYPQNVARIDLGAQVDSTPRSDATALISGDAKASCNLASGMSSLLVSLGKIEQIDSLTFLNTDAKGTVTIATADANLGAESTQWRDAGRLDLHNGALTVKLGPAEAKYVRLTFNVTTPGSISELGIFTAAGAADFTMPRPRRAVEGEIAQAKYNLSDLHTKARAAYVSSGVDMKLANNMLDEQVATSYTFANNDSSPAVVVDLGREMALRRVCVLSNAADRTANFYLSNALPAGSRDATAAAPAGAQSAETLRIDDAALAGFKALGTAADDGSGRVAVDFPETSGRYLLVKWTRPATNESLSVTEIAVFGRATTNMLFAENRAVGSSDKNISDSKDAKDAKDVKDIPAEGPEAQAPAEGPAPALPAQPPFVFVPLIVPTSP